MSSTFSGARPDAVRLGRDCLRRDDADATTLGAQPVDHLDDLIRKDEYLAHGGQSAP